jgi:hypothetical protein
LAGGAALPPPEFEEGVLLSFFPQPEKASARAIASVDTVMF